MEDVAEVLLDIVVAGMNENPDFMYDLNGRQRILKQLVLCGQRKDEQRLAMSSPAWMLSHTLMMTTASMDLLQVIEDIEEAEHLEGAGNYMLNAMAEPMRILGALIGGETFRSLRSDATERIEGAGNHMLNAPCYQ